MWSLETLAQINQAHAETGDARKAYEKCGIRVCGDCPVRGKSQPLPPVEIVRVWRDDTIGWVHQARQGDTILADAGKCRDDLIEQFPHAIRRGRVICGDNEYICEAEAA